MARVLYGKTLTVARAQQTSSSHPAKRSSQFQLNLSRVRVQNEDVVAQTAHTQGRARQQTSFRLTNRPPYIETPPPLPSLRGRLLFASTFARSAQCSPPRKRLYDGVDRYGKVQDSGEGSNDNGRGGGYGSIHFINAQEKANKA